MLFSGSVLSLLAAGLVATAAVEGNVGPLSAPLQEGTRVVGNGQVGLALVGRWAGGVGWGWLHVASAAFVAEVLPLELHWRRELIHGSAALALPAFLLFAAPPLLGSGIGLER